MSRGFKKDLPATEAAHFSDPRSFISLPKRIDGEGPRDYAELFYDLRPHLILYGVDKAPIRAEIFRRNREENGGENRCWKCGQIVFEDAPEGAYYRGQWHHLRNKPGMRCDCVFNGVVSCSGTCHQTEHVQVQLRSGKIMQAPDEFP